MGTMGCERDYGKGGMVDEKSGAEERGSAPLLQVHQEGGKRGGEGKGSVKAAAAGAAGAAATMAIFLLSSQKNLELYNHSYAAIT